MFRNNTHQIWIQPSLNQIIDFSLGDFKQNGNLSFSEKPPSVHVALPVQIIDFFQVSI